LAKVDDYTSGIIQEQAAQALSLLKSSGDSLAGSEMGDLLLAKIQAFQPRRIDMTEAEQRIRDATHCAAGPRVCHAGNPQSEFTEAVFLDELAEAMVAAGKAEMVSREKAVGTLAKYRKHPLVLSTVSAKPMELCRTSPETCVYWNMEKRDLKCVGEK
jgi:hypothetical protein